MHNDVIFECATTIPRMLIDNLENMKNKYNLLSNLQVYLLEQFLLNTPVIITF